MLKSGAAISGGPKGLLFDTLALLIFQVPIYAAIIWMGGASGVGLLWGIAGAAVIRHSPSGMPFDAKIT
jgi:hypothetical protein